LELADALPVDFDDGVSGGTAEEIGGRDETRIIIEEGDEIGIAAAESESEDIRLPHLVGSSALEEARAGEVAALGFGNRIDERGGMQTLADGLRAGLKKKQAAQPLGDTLGAKGRIELSYLDNLFGDCWS
jgi:hypothetical protein